MKQELKFPDTFANYVIEHKRLWTTAQKYDRLFDQIINSDHPHYRFSISIAPSGPNVQIAHDFNYDWEPMGDFRDVPLAVLAEYVGLKTAIEKWHLGDSPPSTQQAR